MDSLNDEFDSDWGNSIYNFRKSEEAKLASNPDYVMRQPIRIVLSLRAEQYIGESEGNDLEFSLGHVFLYDVVANKKCDSIGGNCLKTYVLDTNNVVSDDSVTLLPDIYNVYGIGSFNDYLDIYNSIVASWTVNNRPMVAEDLLKVISTDIVNSYLIRDGLSDTLSPADLAKAQKMLDIDYRYLSAEELSGLNQATPSTVYIEVSPDEEIIYSDIDNAPQVVKKDRPKGNCCN